MNKGCGCFSTWILLMLIFAIPYSLFFYKGPAAPVVKVVEFMEKSDIQKAQSLMCDQKADLSEPQSMLASVEGIENIETDSIEEKEATVTKEREMRNFYDNSLMYTWEQEEKIGVTYKDVKLDVIGKEGTVRVWGEIWTARGYRKRLGEERKSTDNHKKRGECVVILSIY